MPRLSTLAPRLSTLDTRTARPAPKVADPELLTAEHRAWAYAVKQRAGWKCEDCGKQGGRGGCTLYADHIDERRDGGASLDPNNSRCLCASCHSKKTARARAERMGLSLPIDR